LVIRHSRQNSGFGMLDWLGYLCGGFIGLLVLWVVWTVLRVYVRYRFSPEKRWRDRVVRTLEKARRRALAEREAMRQAGVAHDAEDAAARAQAFHAFLTSLPVERLEAYPGIGPGTTSRVREAGYPSLADLSDGRVEVPGLGQKRLADVARAVQDLVKQSRSRFEAGACREAQELAVRLEMLRASRTAEGFRAHARYQAAVTIVQQIEPLMENAQRIDFPAFVLRVAEGIPFPLLPQETLPDLERAIQTADEHAQRAFAASQSEPARLPRAEKARAQRPTTIAAAPDSRVDLFRKALQSPGQPSALPEPPSGPSQAREQQDNKALLLLELTVEFAYAVARSDGRVSRKERALIEERLRGLCGDNPALLNRAKALSAHYESAAIDLDECLRQIAGFFAVEERQELLDFAGAIADASGGRNQREAEFLDRVARKLGTPRPAPPMPAQAAPAPEPAPAAASSPEQRLAVLEIDPATSLTAELVRRQFNLLTERYSPEKFEAAGPDFVTLATTKREAVRAAAEALIEPLGEKLEAEKPPAEPQDLRHNPDLDAMFGA
jgi:tellurite resistance protein